MTQNLITLSVTEQQYNEVDAALATIENHFAGLKDLSQNERRGLMKMGNKSEAFCRQTLVVLAQNPAVVPPGLSLADAQGDLHHLEQLRIRTARVRKLLGRMDDSEVALGSDVMSAALNGYGLLKMMGKGSGLVALRQGISARFARTSRSKGETDPNTPAPGGDAA
ncbi:MAG: hypothetical protein ACOZE7_15030 [Pseudomonadota bacterium]